MTEEPDTAPDDAVIEDISAQPPSPWRRIATFADRTAVLFIGIAVGTVIGGSFFGLRSAPATAPEPVQIVATPASQPAVQAGSSECAARFSGGLTRALAAGRPLHIGVFGDSFGAGVTEGLALQFRGDKSWVVHGFSKQATGFTRYAKLDLLDDIRAKLDAQPIDIAVISFGANDTFDIYDDGIAAKYMSPTWQEIVGKRVDAVIQLLRDRGAQVYWVGLPKMREPDFDVKVTEMNAFYAAHMRALGVPYYDTVPVSVDAGGQYSAHLVDPKTGKSELARANDGVHMATGHAYALLTRGLVTRIRDYVALARADVDRQAALRGRQASLR